MRGHHIYTRSWFELGSKSKNAGTFTVELTPGLLGDKADEIIYNRINPMCATAPETLAPRNTGRSLLRMYHLSLDSTVICRSFFVTDEITERGTVPYSFSLIFRGGDNDVFLRNPTKAFSPDAVEPYHSFRARVMPDAPTVASQDYDPKREDYSEPFVFTKNQWSETWGFDKKLFAEYFASVCEALLSRQIARVGVILPEGKDGETLILATLSLLPMFMKRKFGAASGWTGMMDGSNSNSALNGIQLLCYHDESPISDSKFPIIDLTGGNRHENLNSKCRDYAEWVWENIDNTSELSMFESFLIDNFESVLAKMPVEVVQNCFLLWFVFVYQKIPVTFELAMLLVRLIADNFAKSFSRYPFIATHLKICLEVLRKGITENPQADIKGIKDIQAVCLLAGNGEETAQKLVYEMYRHFYNRSEWKKITPPLMYYSGLLSQPNISVETEGLCAAVLCESMSCADTACAKLAQDAMSEYLKRLKTVILQGQGQSERAFSIYKDVGFALFTVTNGKYPAVLFKLPEFTEPVNSERFAELMKFEVDQLGFVPGIQHWLDSAKWASHLDDEGFAGLYQTYYSKLTSGKERYILGVEKQSDLFRRLRKPVFGKDAAILFVTMFNDEWAEEERLPENDETWMFLRGWAQRLAAMGYRLNDNVFAEMRRMAGLNIMNLPRIVLSVSQHSILTMGGLYSTETELAQVLETLKMLDSEASSQNGSFRNIAGNISSGGTKDICINRMIYWCRQAPSVERALTVSVLRDPFGLNIDLFLDLCRTGRTGDRYIAADLANMFTALKLGIENGNPAVLRDIYNVIENYILTDLDYEGLFADEAVKKAYRDYAAVHQRQSIGEHIYYFLRNNKRGSETTLAVYSPRNRHSSESSVPPPLFILIAAAAGILLTIVSALLIFIVGNGYLFLILGETVSVWLLYSLVFVILAFSGVNIFMYRPDRK